MLDRCRGTFVARVYKGRVKLVGDSYTLLKKVHIFFIVKVLDFVLMDAVEKSSS